MTAAAQDGTGTVWALPDNNNGYNQNENGAVYYWQAGSWVKQSILEAAGFSAAALTEGDDGSVYALWQKRAPGWYPGQANPAPTPCLLTVHRGTHSRLQSQFTAALPVPGSFAGPLKLYAGKGGDAWIACAAPLLLHIASDGTVRSFPVTPDQVFGGKFVVGFPTQPLYSRVDPLGRRWFWQGSLDSWQAGPLRGFLIWDGKTLAYHSTLPGLPDKICSVIAAHGGRFLWAAQGVSSYPASSASPGGLYKIDTQTGTAAPVALPPKAQPQRKYPQITARIFWMQGDLCVLEADYFDYSSRGVSLWRQRGNAWQKEPDALALDQCPPSGYASSQPVLDTAAGTWLGVSGAGLEWLSANGKSVTTVNWRQGLAAGRVSTLFRLPDGKIMPFPYSGLGALLPPYPPPLLPPRPGITPSVPGQPSGLGDMLADQNRHLWGFAYQPSGRAALEEWDGSQWHAHLLPKFKSTFPSGTLYACDTRGRVWVTIQIWNPPAQAQPVDTRFVYDPAQDAWTQYDTVPDAVAAAAAQPGMAFLPYRNSSSLPVFSGDGRAAYVDSQTLFLYDSKKWRQWKSRDIQPGYAYGNDPDHLRFDKNGEFEVALASSLYGWTSADGWQPKGFAPRVSPPPPLPPGGPAGWYGPLTPDNAGGGWAALGGDVYLTRGGVWRRLAPLSGRGSPFYDGRYLQSVLQDPKGRFFFETNPGSYLEYVVWSPPAALLPAPRIQIRPLSTDSVLLRFDAAPKGPREFQWRLNGGAWQTPPPGSPATLTALHPGTYRVEAQALSPLLQASPVPSAAVFTVQPPTAAQIAGWVRTLLSGTDTAREAAVAGLVKQPAAALPALEAARPGASEAGQWWIDAAVQQLQSSPQN